MTTQELVDERDEVRNLGLIAGWRRVTREWLLEFSDDHGISGSFGLALPDDGASATFTARLTLPGEGVVVVHDDDVAATSRPRSS